MEEFKAKASICRDCKNCKCSATGILCGLTDKDTTFTATCENFINKLVSISDDYMALKKSVFKTLFFLLFWGIVYSIICYLLYSIDSLFFCFILAAYYVYLVYVYVRRNPFLYVALYLLPYKVGIIRKRNINPTESDTKKKDILLYQFDKLIDCASRNDHFNYKKEALIYNKIYMSFDDLDYAEFVANDYMRSNVSVFRNTLYSLFSSRYGYITFASFNRDLNLEAHVVNLCEDMYTAVENDDLVQFRKKYCELNSSLPRFFRKYANKIWIAKHQWYSQNPMKADRIFKYFVERF